MINTTDDLLRLAELAGSSEPEKCRDVLDRAAFAQRSPIAALLDSKLVQELPFLKALASELGIPWREEEDVAPIENVRDKFPARLALGQIVLPEAAVPGGELSLLTFDPFDYATWQAVTQHWRGPVSLVMTSRSRLVETLKKTYGVGADTFEELLEGREDDLPGGAKEEVNVIDEDDSEASVMKFVNQILREGLQQGATDIHFEPLGHDLRIRYRIDGVLQEVPVPQRIKMLQDSLISRLKIMSGLDIAERRRPQDGRIALEIAGAPIDVRVATIPSVNGESVSLRLLGQQQFDFSGLGLDPENEKRIRNLISIPNGIVLVTGPTGSGKSTSLYTFLSAINSMERRIVTIEDPVEHKLNGVIQIAVKPEIDLTFATALRSILRGDPNIVMVGEMRDLETTEIAIRAALTGHLVFSTLHTNDAVGGITRLLDMGVEPFLVGSAVRAFIAQRLVRRLCKHCSQPGEYKSEDLAAMGFPLEWAHKIRRPVGCPHCRNTGFSGRTAIFEICQMTPRMQELIQRRSPANELRELALREGMVPLRKAGWETVSHGVTSVEEVVRVTSSELQVLDE
ncbi:MAG: type II/IV secretion system protein [Verrucomicrobia bacterium]|nr:type II/IV secretion system protein [Verrucomicrobiota bacterium]